MFGPLPQMPAVRASVAFSEAQAYTHSQVRKAYLDSRKSRFQRHQGQDLVQIVSPVQELYYIFYRLRIGVADQQV